MFDWARPLQTGQSISENLFKIWFFGIVPVSTAAFCAFTFGPRLVDGSETTNIPAAARGIGVALLSYILFMAF
jgi:hypothetical protein